MYRNVLEYLEHIVNVVPDKAAFVSDSVQLTFRALYENARTMGTYLIKKNIYRQPVVIFMEKSPQMIAAFMGTMYARDFYIPIDSEMPKYRIELIIEKVQPKIIVCDEQTKEQALAYQKNAEVVLFQDILLHSEIENEMLDAIREKTIDTDPIYIVFTSGSTGIPKGVVACHRSVIDYIESFTEVMGFDENSIFGNQSPLYFDACLKEIYSTLKYGGTTYLIPKSYFMFPLQLVNYINEKKINSICWVVSALTMISSCGTFDDVKPKYLKKIAFGSEVFPIRQLKLWREALPDADFVNLYGPTEATGMSCYYRLDPKKDIEDVVPIGRPFRNTEIFLLTSDNKEALQGEVGEICIRGTAVTLGYYRDEERTNKVFVQNPLQNDYPEIIYKTGDLARLNDEHELVFVSRKDYQIKHMGHRIELGEIEANVNVHELIQTCCCIYDEVSAKIVLYYVGSLEKRELTTFLKERLPRYMLPNYIEQISSMPFTENGKINRVFLKETYQNREK